MKYGSLKSLAVRFPSREMTNDHWREQHPAMVADIERQLLNRTWSPQGGSTSSHNFDEAMRPFLSDPFRGCQRRFWLAEGEDPTEVEALAALDALAAAGLRPSDIDMCIVGSFPPPHIDVGNAAYLARRLGLSCPAWNLEATCSSTLIALQVASGLIQAGQATRVLIITSAWYSPSAPSSEVVSIANGDGACAMVVGESDDPFLLGVHAEHTGSTCDALQFQLASDEAGRPCIRLRLQEHAGRVIRDASERAVPLCASKALEKAALRADEIDFFAFNAAAAWIVPFSTAVVGADPSKTINTHASFGNTGPVLVPTSLFYGAHAGMIPDDAKVFLFGMGNTSNAVAMVIRWRDVRLAPIHTPLLSTH